MSGTLLTRAGDTAAFGMLLIIYFIGQYQTQNYMLGNAGFTQSLLATPSTAFYSLLALMLVATIFAQAMQYSSKPFVCVDALLQLSTALIPLVGFLSVHTTRVSKPGPYLYMLRDAFADVCLLLFLLSLSLRDATFKTNTIMYAWITLAFLIMSLRTYTALNFNKIKDKKKIENLIFASDTLQGLALIVFAVLFACSFRKQKTQ